MKTRVSSSYLATVFAAARAPREQEIALMKQPIFPTGAQ